MAFHVRDRETDLSVRRLARQRGVGLTEAVRLAVDEALAKNDADLHERERRARAVLASLDARPRTGLKADKAFFDEMSGD